MTVLGQDARREAEDLGIPRWLDQIDDYELIAAQRLRNLVPVRERFVLIAEVERSGGSLLSQLFDDHPECHAHPHELWIGERKWQWPTLDLAARGAWFESLFELPTAEFVTAGYCKERRDNDATIRPDVFPFLFSPNLQRTIFERCVAEFAAPTQRAVLDAYWTSYFNAWLDYRNLYTGPKRAVTGFTARMNFPPQLDRFFADYPDGVVISLVRNPCAWFASARSYKRRYRFVDKSMELWRQSAEATIDAHARFPGRVLVATYEQLALETEAVLERIAAYLGITMSPVLLRPTFNGRPIRANAAVAVDRPEVLTERVDGWRNVLTAAEVAEIEALAGDLYERTAALSVLADA